MKTFIKEFKEFALKGNVMSMAVGVIIGGAFQAIVAALTSSFINPLIALVTGGIKYDEAGNPVIVGGSFTINGVAFDYGAFISAIIFLCLVITSNIFLLHFIDISKKIIKFIISTERKKSDYCQHQNTQLEKMQLLAKISPKPPSTK